MTTHIQNDRTALVDNLVRIVNGLPKTETPRISELFNRPHRFVMRSIDKLIENGAINACSVARISYKDSKNREQRAYQLGERESLILMPFLGGRRSEVGQVRLVDSFLSARKEINRLRTLHASPDWQQARIEGKAARHLETDTIKAFVEYAKGQGSSSPERYYQALTKAVYGALFFVRGAVGKDFRSQLSAVQLASVAMAAKIVERASMAAKMCSRLDEEDKQNRQIAGFGNQNRGKAGIAFAGQGRVHPVNLLAHRCTLLHTISSSPWEGGFSSPEQRRTNRHQCGFFTSVSNTATLSMGATCGRPSGLPEPLPGLLTRTFAPTPFSSGKRDSKRLQRNHPMPSRTPGASASIRLSVYRFIRRFAGPVTAVRWARFIGRASA